jgi:virulence-associated protein VapD
MSKTLDELESVFWGYGQCNINGTVYLNAQDVAKERQQMIERIKHLEHCCKEQEKRLQREKMTLDEAYTIVRAFPNF